MLPAAIHLFYSELKIVILLHIPLEVPEHLTQYLVHLFKDRYLKALSL